MTIMAKRLAKTTHKQYEELINFVKKNKIVLRGKYKPHEYRGINFLWQNIAIYINSLGVGPQKTAKQWRNVLAEWKQNTRKKRRRIQLEIMTSGGGPYTNIKLTPAEEELVSLLEKVQQGKLNIADSVTPCSSELKTEDIVDSETIEVIRDEDNYDFEGHETNKYETKVSPDSVQTELKNKMYIPSTSEKKPSSRNENRNMFEEAINGLQTQEHQLQAGSKNTESVSAIAEAINNFSTVYKGKLKLEYYKVFGTFENFHQLFS